MKNLEISTFEYKGVRIITQIDYDNGRISFVERNNHVYRTKPYMFGDRELQFMGGWLNILEALKRATKIAQEKLSEHQKEVAKKKEKADIDLHMAIAKEDARQK